MATRAAKHAEGRQCAARAGCRFVMQKMLYKDVKPCGIQPVFPIRNDASESALLSLCLPSLTLCRCVGTAKRCPPANHPEPSFVIFDAHSCAVLQIDRLKLSADLTAICMLGDDSKGQSKTVSRQSYFILATPLLRYQRCSSIVPGCRFRVLGLCSPCHPLVIPMGAGGLLRPI